MKIAVWHNLGSGGAKRALAMHLRGLSERGHDLRIYTTDHSDRHYLPLHAYGREHVLPLRSNPGTPRWRSRLSARLFGSHAAEAIHARIAQMEAHAQECRRAMAEDQREVLFANSCRFLYNSPIGTAVDLPSLIYLGEPCRRLYEASPSLPWILPDPIDSPSILPIRQWRALGKDLLLNHANRRQVTTELRWARGYDRILVNSRFSRESLLRSYNLESHLCLLGVEMQAFGPMPSEKRNMVAGLGSITPAKRVDRAVEAIARIPSARRPSLCWVGNLADGGYLNKVRALAEKLEVRFETHVDIADHELGQLISAAACLFYAPHLEPFGLAPLEANACGTAVVGLAEAGVRETVCDGVNGYLADEPDPDEFAALLMRFTDDPTFARRMGQQARRHVELHWSPEAAIDRLEHHLLTVCGAR